MDSVDCHNIQHDGGVSYKIVENAVGDKSQTKIFKFCVCRKIIQKVFTKQLVHDINSLIKDRTLYSRQIERVANL